jgi:hypothetical protein
VQNVSIVRPHDLTSDQTREKMSEGGSEEVSE